MGLCALNQKPKISPELRIRLASAVEYNSAPRGHHNYASSVQTSITTFLGCDDDFAAGAGTRFLFSRLHFRNKIVKLELTGATLRGVLEHGVSRSREGGTVWYLAASYRRV